MAEIEELAIAIEVIDRFTQELNQLLFKLGQVETAVEAVDDITIDVDVRGERELDSLVAQMAMLEGMDMSGVGDIVVGDKRVSRSSGGGGVSRRAIRSQTDRLEQTIAGLSRQLDTQLGEALDNTGESAHKAASNMFDAAEETGSFADSLMEGDIRMTDLHNAMARVVPLLLVFVGAIPAVVGGLLSLAAAAVAAGAALAALTGFAAVGLAQQMGDGDIGEGFEQMWGTVEEDFLDAFSPLFRRLAPVFRDGLNGLNRFFEAVAAEGDALVGLSDEARDVGQWMIENVPPFLRDVALFADAASGALGAVVEGMAGMDTFGALADLLQQSLPLLMVMFGLISRLIPHIFEFSLGFLRVTNVLLYLIDGLFGVLSVMGLLNKQLGTLVAATLAAAAAWLLLNTQLFTAAGAALVSLGQSIIGAVAGLWNMVGGLTAAQTSLLATAAATKVLAGAIALTGIGAVAVVLGMVAGRAATASTNIDEATKSLKAFQRQSRRMDSGQNPYADPDVGRSGGTGASRFSGSSVTVNIGGDADDETVRNQTQNALYRIERPQRSR